jgi:group I intron endonuclease
MKKAGIYKIKNTKNGNLYIGQSIDIIHRKSCHWSLLHKNKHNNIHLQYAWNKYGWDKFIYEIILLCEPSELTYYEQALVDMLLPKYNIRRECVTSCLGVKATESAKKKMSEARLGEKNHLFGKHHSLETLKKISIANSGRVVSEETRAKLSANSKGKNNANYGKHFSDEVKKKISESEKGKTISEWQKLRVSETHRGKPLTEEHRKKIGEANRRRVYSEETRKKMSESQKLARIKRKEGVTS